MRNPRITYLCYTKTNSSAQGGIYVVLKASTDLNSVSDLLPSVAVPRKDVAEFDSEMASKYDAAMKEGKKNYALSCKTNKQKTVISHVL